MQSSSWIQPDYRNSQFIFNTSQNIESSPLVGVLRSYRIGAESAHVLSFSQEPENRKKNQKADKKENNSTLVMEIALKETWIHIACEKGQGHNPDPILQDHHEESACHEDCLFPELPKIEMAHE